MTNQRKKKDAEEGAETSRAQGVKPIRLRDLLPRHDVKGGKKSLFGTRDEDTNGANSSTRED